MIKDRATLKWLINKSRPQIPSIILVVIINISFSVLTVIFSLFCKEIIDSATSKDKGNLILYSTYLFLCILFLLIFQVLRRSIEERIKSKLEIIYKSCILYEILKKDYAKITSFHSGELLNRLFSDVKVISEGNVSIITNISSTITKFVCAFSVLVILDKKFAFTLLFIGAVMFFGSRLFRKKIKLLHKSVQEKDGLVRSFIQELIESLLIVQVFGVQDKMNKKSDMLQENYFKAQIKRRNISILASSGFGFIFDIGYFYALLYSAMGLYLGTITFGTLTAIIQLVDQVQQPFANLSGIIPQYYSILASAERLIEINEIENEKEITINNLNIEDTYKNLKLIEFKDINFKYDRDIIFDRANLSINKGDFVAITGISGIGKSTLLKLLLGVFKLDEGEIYLNTNNKCLCVDKNIRRLFSYVPQGHFLFSGTIKDNLTFINENALDSDIERALRISSADSFINTLPNGINTVIGERGMGLSEGQVQRLSIARAILSNAPILLFDEATSALDENTEKKVLENLKAMKNITLIIISHKKAAASICNKEVKIENKKIIVREVCHGL